jgi:hypothetical protein
MEVRAGAADVLADEVDRLRAELCDQVARADFAEDEAATLAGQTLDQRVKVERLRKQRDQLLAAAKSVRPLLPEPTAIMLDAAIADCAAVEELQDRLERVAAAAIPPK